MQPAAIPTLAELSARYLQRQTEASRLGLTGAAEGEVLPYQAVLPRVDPRLAWEEALAPLQWLIDDNASRTLRPPSEWAGLVATIEPLAAVPCCVGNFPQLVRDIHPFLHQEDLAAPRPDPVGQPLTALPNLSAATLATQPLPARLVGLGLLRLTRRFDEAWQVANAADRSVPALMNEIGALHWHQGNLEEAASIWQRHSDRAPLLFNQGLAHLFLGRAEQAVTAFARAVALMPESNAWHHLGKLYATLAQGRGSAARSVSR